MIIPACQAKSSLTMPSLIHFLFLFTEELLVTMLPLLDIDFVFVSGQCIFQEPVILRVSFRLY